MVSECSLSKDLSEYSTSNLQLAQPYIALVVPQRTVDVKSAQQVKALACTSTAILQSRVYVLSS